MLETWLRFKMKNLRSKGLKQSSQLEGSHTNSTILQKAPHSLYLSLNKRKSHISCTQ